QNLIYAYCFFAKMRINIGFKAIFFEKAIRKRQYTVNHIELGVGSELELGVGSELELGVGSELEWGVGSELECGVGSGEWGVKSDTLRCTAMH
ncbi:MAG: hypothetical protein PHP52_12390, partial [Bacteroidales bacterium]|nr:hypothetical protein [Bacteroidales bacterium]